MYNILYIIILYIIIYVCYRYQLPELLSSVECATTANPFARFLATQLHLVNIYENHKTYTNLPETSAVSQIFHRTAGDEKRHFFGRNMELRDVPN